MARPDTPTPIITTNVNRRVIYSLVAMVVALIVGVGLSIGYSAQAVHGTRAANDKAITLAQQVNIHNLQQICGIMVILDDAYRNPQTPPTTALGRQLASAIHAYREFLGCDHLK